MVDLVKIRRKAKEQKDAEAAAEETQAPESAQTKPPKPDVNAAAEKGTAEASTPAPAEKPKPDAPSKDGAAKETKAPQKKVQAAEEKPKEAAPKKPAQKKAPSPKNVAEETESGSEDAAPEPTFGEPDEETLDRLAKFKREAGKRRTWVASAVKGAATETEEEGTADLELLRFRLAGEEYAVDIEKIVEIVPPRGTTRVPNAERSIVGIMSLRGTIVTVFDLRRKLGHPPIGAGQDADRRMIVVEREGETAGFLVDKVSRVVKLDPSELENHPVVSAAEQSDYVGGVFQASDGLVILLDLEKILASQS